MAQELKKMDQQTPSKLDGGERTRARPTYPPPTDIYETEDNIVLLVDMPGVAPEAADITLEKRVLTIRGHAGDREHQGYRRAYTEYGEGDYERVFTLSDEIDRERIEASHSHGTLRLVLPKAGPAKTKKIDVKSA